MTMTVSGPNGITIDFPDGTNPQIIDDVMRQAMSQTAGEGPMGIVKQAGVGVAKGIIGIAGLPGMGQDLVNSGVDYLIDKGLLPKPAGSVQQQVAARQNAPDLMPSPETIQRTVEGFTGEFRKPQNRAERYAGTIGEFATNALIPGGAIRRATQVLAPAVASEFAGEQTQGTRYEGAARVAAALAGGLSATAAERAVGAMRAGAPGVSPAASRVLERNITPGAEARAAELGPDAMLLDTTVPARNLAQGVALRPGPAMEEVVNAVTARHRAGNARLTAELDTTLGPVVNPQAVEDALQAQRAGLQPHYEAVTGLNNAVDLTPVYDQLRIAIPQEAGPTQRALRQIMDMVAPEIGGQGSSIPRQRIPRTAPRDVLNVRQALDDLHGTLGETPKAQRTVAHFRRLVDEALSHPNAVPDIKVLDQTFQNLQRGSEALTRGGQVFDAGKTAIRPEALIAERQAMTLPQREAMRIGTRAEIDRLVGTKSNDMLALRQAVGGDGDWNRVKLAEIFGAPAAQRIINSVDREAAFQSAYHDITRNSQTAQRMIAEKSVPSGKTERADLKGVTLTGLALSGGQKSINWIRDALAGANLKATDQELAGLLTRSGSARDQLITDIRNAQRRRGHSSTATRDFLIRALNNARIAGQK